MPAREMPPEVRESVHRLEYQIRELNQQVTALTGEAVELIRSWCPNHFWAMRTQPWQAEAACMDCGLTRTGRRPAGVGGLAKVWPVDSRFD